MKTDDLIRRLGTDLKPVRPLAPPWQRATIWLLGAGAYLTAVMLLAWLRRGVLVTGDLPYVVQQVAVVATAVAAAFAAFVSVIPGVNRRLLMLPLVPGAVMIAMLGLSCLNDLQLQGTLGLGQETDWPCVLSLAVGGVTLWVLAVAMLRRGAPLAPQISSLLAGLAALSVANLEACVTRPHAYNVTIVVWHGVTMALLLAVLAQAGRRLLVWNTPKTG
jgi:hypothetical protein